MAVRLVVVLMCVGAEPSRAPSASQGRVRCGPCLCFVRAVSPRGRPSASWLHRRRPTSPSASGSPPIPSSHSASGVTRAPIHSSGGSGASPLPPLLDYALMQRAPKALIGYSDITALHMAIQRHAGLVTFHGPGAFRSFTSYTVDALRAARGGPQVPIRLAAPPPFEKREGQVDWENRVTMLVPGQARGRLL